MKISTLSIVVGSKSCDAACPFCISRSTGFEDLSDQDIDWQSFSEAISLAYQANTTTLLFTGKGEPSLYPEELNMYLKAIYALGSQHEFESVEDGIITTSVIHKPIISLIEMQTNGIRIGNLAAQVRDLGGLKTAKKQSDILKSEKAFFEYLTSWRDLGLRTISISAVGTDSNSNKKIYLNHRETDYPDLKTTVDFLHECRYKVRLGIMLHNGIADSPKAVDDVINWSLANNIDQLTFRPIRRPSAKNGNLTSQDKYVDQFGVSLQQEQEIRDYLRATGHHIHTIDMGGSLAPVYDIREQNVCMADCLTQSTEPNTIRTLILYPRSGEIAYDWEYRGSKL